MDIKQLQYFVMCVDIGSIHKAAEGLITTQPNVSKVIKTLEEELDMTLLKRNRNGVSVTDEGKVIYQYAVKVLAEYQMIDEIKAQLNQKKHSTNNLPEDK